MGTVLLSLCSEAMVAKAAHDDLKQKYYQLHTDSDNLHVDVNKLKAQVKATLRRTLLSLDSLRSKAVLVMFLTDLTRALFNWVLQMAEDGGEGGRGPDPGGPLLPSS